MTYNTDAVVLRVIKTGEADRLVTFLTRDKGVVKAFAKSAAVPKNKLHMSTQMFCYGHYTFYEGKNSTQVNECELSETFPGLRDDIASLALAQYFNELIIETVPTDIKSDEYLRLLLNSLYFLSHNQKDIKILKSVFELRLVSMIGYMPSLVGCVSCGAFESEPMYFNEYTGEIFCNKCAIKESTLYPLEVITAMRHIVYSNLSKVFALTVSDKNIYKLNKATEKYLMAKVPKKFNSLRFYKEVR